MSLEQSPKTRNLPPGTLVSREADGAGWMGTCLGRGPALRGAWGFCSRPDSQGLASGSCPAPLSAAWERFLGTCRWRAAGPRRGD